MVEFINMYKRIQEKEKMFEMLFGKEELEKIKNKSCAQLKSYEELLNDELCVRLKG